MSNLPWFFQQSPILKDSYRNITESFDVISKDIKNVNKFQEGILDRNLNRDLNKYKQYTNDDSSIDMDNYIDFVRNRAAKRIQRQYNALQAKFDTMYIHHMKAAVDDNFVKKIPILADEHSKLRYPRPPTIERGDIRSPRITIRPSRLESESALLLYK